MTISTYTEPQPVNTAVNEPPQVQETEENAEPGAFAKLLAGLLQKTKTDNEAADVPLVDFSDAEAGIEVLAAEKAIAGHIFAHEDAKISENELSGIEFLETGLSEGEFPEDYLNVLPGAEYLLFRSNDPAADMLQELSTVEAAARLTDIQADTDISSVINEMIDTEDAASLAQNAEFAEAIAAMQGEESLSVETNVKKEREFQKSESIEKLPVDSRRGEEHALLRNEPEKENRSRLDEARSRSRRDKVTFEVRDMRTGTGAETLKGTEMRLNAGMETKAQGGTPVREITLELRLPEGQSVPNSMQAQTTWEAKAGNALENMLARELHQNFNGDIVRHASMALRDGGEGTIRLALKPESLGNVKIQLEMTENKITGRIVVESEEALNAFRKEISSLEQAFRDSGFASADLNLSLTSDGKSTEGREQEANSYAPQTIASRYDDSFGQDSLPLVDVFFGRRLGSINMFA